MSFLLGKKKSKKVVVFLCTGNTCRGPMAQGYMKKAMEERGIKNVEAKTAGVMTIPGLIPTPEATQVMRNAGIDITGHRSSPLTRELIRKADLILGMTPFHVQYALRMSDDAKDKTFLLKEYAESDVKNYQITDPMGMTLEVYKRVYREMKLAIDKMLETKDIFHSKDTEPAPRVSSLAPPLVNTPTPPPAPEAPKAKPEAKPKAEKAPAAKPAPKKPEPKEKPKAPAKKAPEKKAPEKKSPEKKAPEKKAPEKKVAEKKAPAAKAAPEKKAPAAKAAPAKKKAATK